MIAAAVRNALLPSLVLRTQLSEWDFGNTLLPAIFDLDLAPEKAETPFILVNTVGSADNEEAESREDDAIEAVVDVNIWEEKGESRLRLSTIAWEVFEVLRDARGVLVLDGWTVTEATCSTPTYLRDKDGFPGAVVQARIVAVRERS